MVKRRIEEEDVLPPFSEGPALESEMDVLEPQNEIIEDDLDSGDSEDLFGSDMERDYRARPEQDLYDLDNLDDEDYDQMDATTRLLVEEKLKRRDRDRLRQEGRGPSAFWDVDSEDDLGRRLPIRRRHRPQVDLDDIEADAVTL
jgi:DNA replication licensing factor MCM2